MLNPPVTSRVAPVTYEERSEAKYNTELAISSGSPIRPIGIPLQISATTFGGIFSVIAVLMNPGRTALTRTFWKIEDNNGSTRLEKIFHLFSQLLSSRLCESNDSSFCSCVVGLSKVSHLSDNRGNVDNGEWVVVVFNGFPHECLGELKL